MIRSKPDGNAATLAATAAAALWLLLLAGPGRAQNVMIVVADDFGQDLVETYGVAGDAGPTPTIDALAAQGVLFRNAWAHPQCSPARASILTGEQPSRHGVGYAIQENNPDRTVGLHPDAPNLARTLDAAGYYTAAMGK